MKKILFIFFLQWSYPNFSQDFHSLVQKTYGGFEPHKLTRSEINKKMPELESFFKMVQSDTTKYLPDLRKELRRDDNPAYFYYDCGQLLLITSKAEGIEKIYINAIKKADINDLDTDVYWHLLHSLAVKKYDISDLAIEILDVKGFNAVIYGHAFTIDKDYCLYYLLAPLPPNAYVNKLIDRYKTESDETNKAAIVKMLWHSCSCTGNDFLQKLSNDPKTSSSIKAQIDDLDIKFNAEKIIDNKYVDILARRNEICRIITDYTIKEVPDITEKLRKYKCL